MPVTSSQDKKAFWKLIRYDEKILKLMGWDNLKPVEFPKHILLKREVDGLLTAGKKYISIYDVYSRTTSDSFFLDTIKQIDVFVPSEESDIADLVVSRLIKSVCNGQFKVNNRYPKLDAQVGDTAAPNGFYCHSVRFFYYSTVC